MRQRCRQRILQPIPVPSLKLLLLLMPAVVHFSCGSQNREQTGVLPSPVELLPYSAFALDFPQSEFVQAKGLCMDENAIFISEQEGNWIKQYDHAGKQVDVFGGTGGGPGEFDSLTHLQERDGLLFALDYSHYINVFDDQKAFVDKVFLSSTVVETRFAVDEAMNIYIATPISTYPISVYDLNGSFKRGFGARLGDRPEEVQRLNDNARFLFLNKAGNLVSISRSKAHVEIYSREGELLHERQLQYTRRFRPFFNKVEDFYSQNPQKWSRSTFQAVVDAVLIDDKLLVLHVGETLNPDWDALMIIDVAGDHIGEPKDYVLKGKDGGKITSRLMTGMDDLLLIYDSRLNWIFRFRLPPSLFKGKTTE